MGYQALQCGEEVFHQGDVGTTLYIILTGHVDVQVAHR